METDCSKRQIRAAALLDSTGAKKGRRAQTEQGHKHTKKGIGKQKKGGPPLVLQKK